MRLPSCISQLYISTVLFILLLNTRLLQAISCYKCENPVAPCNHGRCDGIACVKIEHSVNGQTSVHKGCDNDQKPDSRCTHVDGVSGVLRKCTCVYDYCNDDKQLEQAGLQIASNAAASNNVDVRPKRVTETGETRGGMAFNVNHLIMLIFLCLFVSGSFGLLIMNTVCVHLC